jgi:archaellum component FlaC
MADLLHEKDVEIRDLKKQVSKLLMHLEYVRAEISRLETEHYRGL